MIKSITYQFVKLLYSLTQSFQSVWDYIKTIPRLCLLVFLEKCVFKRNQKIISQKGKIPHQRHCYLTFWQHQTVLITTSL